MRGVNVANNKSLRRTLSRGRSIHLSSSQPSPKFMLIVSWVFFSILELGVFQKNVRTEFDMNKGIK
jgi:hypothetical protein